MSDPTLKNGRKRIEKTESKCKTENESKTLLHHGQFEKPSILFLNNVVSALTITTNRQEKKERKILIKTLMYWELRAIKVYLTAV